MEYISTEEIAKKWGVNQRQVQKLLAGGRVSGAIKFGRVWMLPEDTKKPVDLRCNDKTREGETLSDDLARMLDVSSIKKLEYTGEETLEAIQKDEIGFYYEGGIAYWQGDFEKTKNAYYKAEGNDAVKLLISSAAIAAAIALSDFPFYSEIEAFLKNIIQTADDKRVSTLAELSLMTAYIGAFAPKMAPEWLINGDFSDVFEGARTEAAYRRATYFQSIGDYTSMLSVSETALAFCVPSQLNGFPGYNLKAMCATANYFLEKEEMSKQWWLDVMHSCLKYGFVTPVAEQMTLLGRYAEQLLKREYPQYYTAVVEQCERLYVGWSTFHNHFTKNNVTSTLSLREYQMALLVIRGFPIKEIAKRFDLSVGRQKVIMHEIYAKLFITNRKDLAKCIFAPQNP